MALSRLELVAETRQNIKRDSSAFPWQRIVIHLNWAQGYIAGLHTFEEMRHAYSGVTPSDSTEYRCTFPTRMKDIHSLKLMDGSNSRKLTYATPRTFDKEIPYREQYAADRPLYYVDYGAYFELHPIPDAAYDMILRCSVFPPDLAADASESELVGKDALLVAVATSYSFLAIREIEDATYWMDGIAKQHMMSALASDHSAEDWEPVARPFSAAAVSVDHTNPFAGRSM